MLVPILLLVYALSIVSNGLILLSTQKLLSFSVNFTIIALKVDTDLNSIELEIQCASNRWFGVGFGGSIMQDTYSIIASGTNSVEEYKLASSSSSTSASSHTLLTPRINITSDNIATNPQQLSIRKIFITRQRTGLGNDYYGFPNAAGDINIIWATGSSAGQTAFAYHSANRGSMNI